uniref:Movement protein 1 n=1 Tax=Maize mild mottle virus TaxID=2931827 RepID=A0A8T9JCQ2_9VIRU|nr:movement protein 1 [Maize mild mottle virus]
MSTPETATDTTQLSAPTNKSDPKDSRRSARLQLAHQSSRAVSNRAQSAQDTASANFVIVADKVEVTNNFNF